MTTLPRGLGLPRGGKLTNRDHIGNCVRCKTGIYTGDPIHRGRGQLLGALCGNCGPTPTRSTT